MIKCLDLYKVFISITLLFGTLAQAQDYPNKPITLIVPFAPGGGSDLVSRVVANELSKGLGQRVVIENKAGAGGNIGFAAGSSAAPDGYTLTTITQNISAKKLARELSNSATSCSVPFGSPEKARV